ncbi:MAG: RrF2 family transcriptional regulator [bacterium]
MRLSNRSAYGVRAALDLAMNSCLNPVTIKDLSDRQEVSIDYLEQIMYRLGKADLVRSVRGPGGGYVLAKNPADITVGQIVRALEEDGLIVSVKCFNPRERGDGCDNARSSVCVTRKLWERITAGIDGLFDAVSLKDLCYELRDLMVMQGAGREGAAGDNS